MLLINLDDKQQGLAIVDGVAYRVTGQYGMEVTYPETSDRRKLTIKLNLNDTLDEEQQRRRIRRLEDQLQVERDRLEEIGRLVNGDDQEAMSDAR